MRKRKLFWIGLAVGLLLGYLYGWLSISLAHAELARAHEQREIELKQIKKILYYQNDVFQQRQEIFEWNQEAKQPMPIWATEPKEEQ